MKRFWEWAFMAMQIQQVVQRTSLQKQPKNISRKRDGQEGENKRGLITRDGFLKTSRFVYHV